MVIDRRHQEAIELAAQSIRQNVKKVSGDHWRLNYHISTEAFWMNDPNGFSTFKNEYHLFYQHHPYSAEWGPMFWGHVKSKDLVFWEHLPIALAPSEEYDLDGCFSGSAIEKDGFLYVLYTGNVWTGNDQDTDLRQTQCLAVSEDGIHFNKINQNPVMLSAPKGEIHPHHFRDPKVWKHGDDYYCVVGSRTKDHQGQALLYHSKDLMDWEFMNVMAKSDGKLGYMWECPDFFHLDGHDILMISPQGMEPVDDLYQNLHQAGYIQGKLDYETGLLHYRNFQLLDYGFDFYAPQTIQDLKGRRIMIAWLAMWESEMPEQKNNWAGAMTIPRELTVQDNKILVNPISEFEKLRENAVQYTNITVEGEHTFHQISSDSYEIEVIIEAQASLTFGMKVRRSEALNQETLLMYDRTESLLELNRDRSGSGPKGRRVAPVKLYDNKLCLRIFIDKSSIEVFINHGEKVMSARIYPDQAANGISFFSDKKITLIKFQKWDLNKSISIGSIEGNSSR
ncbi:MULTISPECIES: glycoside hydrolase family 32 protein [Peribacillus]|uniref:Sucrose-6-phosphate hydrolase n=1 Tax=Peribacillus simplex TaxID=1478 RepID=A0A109MWK1_9BACI|nr:glycoside hydrolase family 32 protein [Peribacillus simplex]KWW17279.1 sucrose-6-phosphate hydrolase [Peribacillus simplex]